MAATARLSKIKQAETDIAVLQVQVRALDEKMDELKVDLKEMREAIVKGSEDTMQMLRDFQTSNQEQHNTLSEKVSILERWRWMLMGAAAVAGAMGFETIQAFISQ